MRAPTVDGSVWARSSGPLCSHEPEMSRRAPYRAAPDPLRWINAASDLPAALVGSWALSTRTRRGSSRFEVRPHRRRLSGVSAISCRDSRRPKTFTFTHLCRCSQGRSWAVRTVRRPSASWREEGSETQDPRLARRLPRCFSCSSARTTLAGSRNPPPASPLAPSRGPHAFRAGRTNALCRAARRGIES